MTPDPSETAPVRPHPLVLFFGSGFLTGYAPFASGTVGSALAAAIYYFVPGFEGSYIIMPVTFAFFLLGISAGEKMERYYGNDPSEVTMDEVVGMWFSLFLLPKTLLITLMGFFIFRALDIIKPYPARRFEQSGGGFGIMMDDVIAGFYTNLILHVMVAVLQFTGL